MIDRRQAKDGRRASIAYRWSFIIGWLSFVMLQLAACGGQQNAQPTAAPTQAATAPAATAPATAAVAEEPTPGPDEFVNPVIDQDFPDPDALKVDDTYYVYATNAAGANTQTARSTDLVSWEMLGDALPTLPAWALSGYTWAPEVTTSADGQTFVMYFTARDSASGKQCIGVATSEAPAGPFTSDAEQPLICQLDEGGSIDASAFVDEDGERYVLWKNDGNCCSLPVYLYLQPVSDDGLTLEGEPTQLITNDQAWEGNLVEAPTLWRNADTYYLFYSANNYAGVDYAVGYAVADAITGPYTKPSAAPLLATDFGEGDALGPGGQDIVVVEDGETWMLYHSWNSDASYRRLQIDELVWEGETPVVQGPDTNPQPRPFE